jgi:hypothetical protein
LQDPSDHDISSSIMTEAPIQIRNPDVVRDIRALAELTGTPLTDAVANAVRARLDQIRAAKEARIADKIRKVDEIVRRFNALPVTGPLLTDVDLYDEDGLPK